MGRVVAGHRWWVRRVGVVEGIVEDAMKVVVYYGAAEKAGGRSRSFAVVEKGAKGVVDLVEGDLQVRVDHYRSARRDDLGDAGVDYILLLAVEGHWRLERGVGHHRCRDPIAGVEREGAFGFGLKIEEVVDSLIPACSRSFARPVRFG